MPPVVQDRLSGCDVHLFDTADQDGVVTPVERRVTCTAEPGDPRVQKRGAVSSDLPLQALEPIVGTREARGEIGVVLTEDVHGETGSRHQRIVRIGAPGEGDRDERRIE